MDRLHRLGQERDCRIFRLAMESSIEERMLSFQEAKAQMAKGSMEKLKKEDLSKAKLTALNDLFELEEGGTWDILDDFIDNDEGSPVAF